MLAATEHAGLRALMWGSIVSPSVVRDKCIVRLQRDYLSLGQVCHSDSRSSGQSSVLGHTGTARDDAIFSAQYCQQRVSILNHHSENSCSTEQIP